MKHLSIVTICIIICLSSIGQNKQNVSLSIGFNNNFTPVWSFSPEIGAAYQMNKGGTIGWLLMNDWMGNKTYNIPYYKAKLSKRASFIGGLSFVNDYSGDTRILKESPAIGVNWDTQKNKGMKGNFYYGFLYTNSRIYLRAGWTLWVKKD